MNKSRNITLALRSKRYSFISHRHHISHSHFLSASSSIDILLLVSIVVVFGSLTALLGVYLLRGLVEKPLCSHFMHLSVCPVRFTLFFEMWVFAHNFCSTSCLTSLCLVQPTHNPPRCTPISSGGQHFALYMDFLPLSSNKV